MSKSKPSDLENLTYEEALKRLEQIVEMLEDDPPELEEALRSYEHGLGLARYCLERLDAAELRIQELRPN